MTTRNRRSRWILIATVIALVICAGQLVYLQIVIGPTLASEGQAVRTRSTAIEPKRGRIEDATGVVLADSILTYDLAVNQVNIASYIHRDDDGVVIGRGPAEAARQLAPLLGMSEAEVGGLLVGDSTYQYVKRHVDVVTYRQIRALDIYGIEAEAVYERTYPNGNVAAPVIGTVNAEGIGSSGLEAEYDTLLTGVAGEEGYEIAPNGAVIPGAKKTLVEPTDGASLSVTLHADLQHQVQALLDERVVRHEAEWGAVVIEDISTGKILVMADSGSTEPDNAKPQPVAAVQYAFEPGSVGKVLTIASALDHGAITPTTPFTVPDTLDLPDAGGPITDFHPHEVETLTATGILAESSNTGTVLIGQKLSDEQRHETFTAFGLGQGTGIELAGESPGLVPPWQDWVGRDRYVNMFGQAYMMTALQEASVMATIGNGGVRLPPRIVKSWTNPDGTVEAPAPAEPVQAITAEHSRQLLTMMESVVAADTGTASTARVDGYRLAVKTGTADIIIGGEHGIVSTTAGIVPADEPRLAISVVLYNPKVAVISSDSSAPLFGDITETAVRSLGIPASAQPAELYPTNP
ncbi:penicillin-binding protein 2 [Actinomyces sp. B33]|uniref:peptidoglycan D,D-transpeptidase FtsI family protein n=1 Tax=Actinomyces sp. B33 TaxID=2942131 RepID=UPI0023421E19|nr:penicillin-binding protein 2 [Actinomyces sp. B33]MDC4233077.1 penicillin-binding protein 2 [Actinomyces sp. B33]